MPGDSAKTKRPGASSACCTISTTSAGPTPRIIRCKAPRSWPSAAIRQHVIYAIKSHADYLPDCPRVSPLDKTLYACDELAGFITAVAKVRPEGIRGLKASSVKKKLKQKSFAAAVSREDITQGAADLGVELDEHIQFVIDAIAEIADELELNSGAGA